MTLTYGPDGKPFAGAEKPDGGGLRYNAGKNLIELVPPEWEWALADVTTQGSKKYEKRNWERGMDWSTMIGCDKRHVAKFLAGERYDGLRFDKEAGTTGCHHLAMAAWNLLALMSYDLRGIGNNDLPKLSMGLLASVNAVGAERPSAVITYIQCGECERDIPLGMNECPVCHPNESDWVDAELKHMGLK